MKMICIIGILFPIAAHAWGERGHTSVAVAAARTVRSLLPVDADVEAQAMARFLEERADHLSYLANVPDHLWRDGKGPEGVRQANSPNHNFYPELIVASADELRALPTSYSVLNERFGGKPSRLAGFPDKTLDFYKDVGNSPWRAQQLYDLMVKAFQCAKNKEDQVPSAGDYTNVGKLEYVCSNQTNRLNDLTTAVVMGGVLAHFIGDQVNPYHGTVDDDGWYTGNGGIHYFFETFGVQEQDGAIEWNVIQKANTLSFQNEVEHAVRWNHDLSGDGMIKLMWNILIAAQETKSSIAEVDSKYAITEKSEKLPLGDDPRFHDAKVKQTKRRPNDDLVETLAAFRPLVVERLATGGVISAKIWLNAWNDGGRPRLSDILVDSLPFPHQPRFVWPDYR